MLSHIIADSRRAGKHRRWRRLESHLETFSLTDPKSGIIVALLGARRWTACSNGGVNICPGALDICSGIVHYCRLQPSLLVTGLAEKPGRGAAESVQSDGASV
jgi:hypothetical protein